jgi:hypothetical protein
LLLPLIFKDKGNTAFNAPDLSEMEYSEVFFNNDNENIKLSVIKHLQGNDVAVLIPDKRGCEKSEGEWIGAGF